MDSLFPCPCKLNILTKIWPCLIRVSSYFLVSKLCSTRWMAFRGDGCIRDFLTLTNRNL